MTLQAGAISTWDEKKKLRSWSRGAVENRKDGLRTIYLPIKYHGQLGDRRSQSALTGESREKEYWRDATTFAPIYLMKTKLVLTGKSKLEIFQATGSAVDKREPPALEPGAMCYMMSRRKSVQRFSPSG